MNDFVRFNKVAGVYWLKDPIKNVTIKVKLKPKDVPISLPKFEDYTTSHDSIQQDRSQEYTFKWQEKVFSAWELQRYMDIHNCITDTELTYHQMIEESDYEPSKVFTYVHDDFYLPLPNDSNKSNVSSLSSCFEKLWLKERVSGVVERSSMGNLFKSEESLSSEQWTAMHVVLDNSEYNEDSHLLLKQELTLISLYHNTTHNYLIMSPDVNDLELNPYDVEAAGIRLEYQYGIQVDFGETWHSEDLVTLLEKLYKKWLKRHKQLVRVSAPPLDRRLVCLTLEILTADNFDMDDLYVEYHIKIPEAVQCDGALHGRTHVTRSSCQDGSEKWAFGYIIELGLEMHIGTEITPLQMFFEVISTDWWGRHRTEGYTYLPLTLTPGRHKKQLSCSRPQENDKMAAESRRFFVGGCHLIKDLDILAKPQLQDANFTYVSTGLLNLRWDVVSQTHIPGFSTPQPSTSSSSAVLLGAEAVLRQYRKARAKLAAATKDLPCGDI
ncbi:tectonic-like complex member MKS1 [Amyelois transitella]|uniref:tectonic-like complex member MKS1 n=1 Tax=Amyelois transitella TaxID=680683 RepID=UPI0029901B68|nr:tectonic-like complex member MKS1 [Amyelois transitella]